MGIGSVAVRALFAYLVLLVFIRATGKRTVAQATAFDFVLALVLGDLVDDAIWAEVPATGFLVAVGVLILTHKACSWAESRSISLARVLGGKPALVVCRGAPIRNALRRERVGESELAALLRIHQVGWERLSEVREARVEIDGQMSLLKEPHAALVRRRDVGLARGSAPDRCRA